MTARTRRRLGRWGSTVLGLIVLLTFLFPIYWMVATSVKTTPDIFAIPPSLVPSPIDLGTWRVAILGDPRVLRYILNSVVIATGTTLLTLLLATPAAYALAKLPIRGKSAVLLLSLASLMFPAIMLSTPLFVIFSRLHLIDTYQGLILADTTLALPYAIVLLRPHFVAVPSEITEAALIDGCSTFGAFRLTALPLARSGLATVAVFSFLWGWGDFVFALTLANSDRMRPVTTGLWAFIGPNTTQWGAVMAFSTLAMIPPLVVFLIGQRQVAGGITAGGLKG